MTGAPAKCPFMPVPCLRATLVGHSSISINLIIVRQLRAVTGEPAARSISAGSASRCRRRPDNGTRARRRPRRPVRRPGRLASIASAAPGSASAWRGRASTRCGSLRALLGEGIGLGHGLQCAAERTITAGAKPNFAAMRLLERRLQRRRLAVRVEDDIAALDIGPDVAPAELAHRCREARPSAACRARRH